MNQAQKNYEQLHQMSRHTQILQGIHSLLNWDQETYMPSGANEIRTEQQAALAKIIHQERIGKPFSQALSKLIDIKTGKILAKGLSKEQQAALREWRRDFQKDSALPLSFVEEWTKLTSQSIEVWRSARKDNAFQRFAPFLERLITMSRKKADFLGFEQHPYDALLDLYEPEATTKEISTIFTKLRKEVTNLLKKIVKAKQVNDAFLFGKFPAEKQIAFSKKLLDAMGYDMQHGRVDFSTHPFSSSLHPTDSRITTRIHPSSVMSNLFIILHEGGHSLYEMGLPAEYYGTPLGSPISYGIHESQSRWWETRIGQSKAFWEYFFPLLKKEFKGKLEKTSFKDFYRAINKVEPSLIRVEADEVTYTLHVILRFEIEKDLMDGSLKVRDIPEAWNAKMKEYLGIVPSNNAEGCLQDIHWSMGAFGYFPSYTLGNLYASQLFSSFEKENPDWQAKVARGNLLFVKDWLNTSVHQYGRCYTGKELMKKITKQSFSEKAFVDYLNTKYSEIYSL